MASIKKIAEASSVSVATVSRVLNNPEKVLPKTRQKVLHIIEKFEYVPNPLAKALATGGTNLIAMIIPTLNNSFFAKQAEGCQVYLLGKGYNLVIICSDKYSEHEIGILKSIDQRQFKGMIIAGSGIYESEYPKIIKQVNIPLVIIEDLPNNYSVSSVFNNDMMGVKAAIDHLVKTGHARIAAVTGESNFIATKRRLRYLQSYLQEKFPGYELPVVTAEYSSPSTGRNALETLMNTDPRPTAVLAFNDMIALGLIKASYEIGIRIPEELSVIGFDDIPMASFSKPSLSTVYSPSEDLGKEAAKLLLDQIDNQDTSVKNILIPVKLILRESTINT